MTMVVMAVLVTLTAAFVGVNRSNSALTGNTVSREAAFKAWLDPANFDASGAQRRGLRALREQT